MNKPERVAILHYHLRPGGVTRVIQRAQEALETHGIRTVALSERNVSGLAYGAPAVEANQTLNNLKYQAREALGGEPDLWHIHNHSVGKNATLPLVVKKLANEGCALCLQPHDFAEDGRPSNYAYLRKELGASYKNEMYPTGPRIHYALLTRRDHDFMKEAGGRPETLHVLPNPVALTSENEDEGPEKPPLILYPTRAIRRKNLGEFLLWSALAEGDEHFAVTLAPDSSEARILYDNWVVMATRLGLPVTFEYGTKHPGRFLDILRSATAHATTSIAEGFGLAYLEGWLAGRPLVGRRLTEITADFADEGVDLSSLYTTCPVPLELVGEETFRATVKAELTYSRELYGRKTTPEHVDEACRAAMEDGMVDFGRLDEAMQDKVIRRVARSPELRKSLGGLATWRNTVDQDQVAQNAAAIRSHYSLEQYGERLMDIYQKAFTGKGGVTGQLDNETLLDTFLHPNRFFLLRT